MSRRIWSHSLAIVGIGIGLQAVIGCTGTDLREAKVSDASLRAAVEERADATRMVAKAVERYCALRTDTLEAKQRCVIGQHVELQFIAGAGSTSSLEEIRRASVAGQSVAQPIVTGLLLQCEANGRSITCRRKPPAFAELLRMPRGLNQ
jgi:hypothetical protein